MVKPFSADVALVVSAIILFDNETVSLANLLDNIAEVSAKFNFAPEVAPVAIANAITFFET